MEGSCGTLSLKTYCIWWKFVGIRGCEKKRKNSNWELLNEVILILLLVKTHLCQGEYTEDEFLHVCSGSMSATFVSHIFHLHKLKPGSRKFYFCNVYYVLYKSTNKLAKPTKSFHRESIGKKIFKRGKGWCSGGYVIIKNSPVQ